MWPRRRRRRRLTGSDGEKRETRRLGFEQGIVAFESNRLCGEPFPTIRVTLKRDGVGFMAVFSKPILRHFKS